MKPLILYFLLFVSALFLPSLSLKAQIEDFKVGTTTRKMLVYAPSGIETNRPLLLSLHGLNQDIAYQQNQTKWETIAKANNFVLVYPGGINNSWDISGTSDTDFILAIIDEMVKRYGIDRDRVYLSGFSMGGMMTYHAATKIADKIAAFAPVSGYLMGGPNTNSSRPIPIIHTHGTADDVVVYSGVQKCLDAWITRNKCTKTAQITQPYPVGKNSSNATKYYWGSGTDSVEIVLMSIKGTGHWHSMDPNGINTSQEIWDFCKKFSLGFGVPKLVSTSVPNENPKQVHVSFSLPINELNNFNGFTVKINNQVVTIDSVILANPNNLVINLTDNISNTSEILLSYSNGNVVSTYNKKLVNFNETLVENLLPGAPPRIIELNTSENGDSFKVSFNKKMQLPSDVSTLLLKAEFNGSSIIPILQTSFFNSDSTVLVFSLGEKVYADHKLSLSYSGNNIASADSSYLKPFIDFNINNKAKGLPVEIVSGALEANAFTVVAEFSKSMALTDGQLSQLILKVNGTSVSYKEFNVQNNSIRFILNSNLHYGDSIKLSYTPGNITAADKGALNPISNFTIENPLSTPNWKPIPGKIEAEDFTLQYGIDTEPVSDIGGGLNIGWTDAGDWLEYTIENNTEETEYEISFRVAAQAAGNAFSYYIDNVKMGQVSVPNTGGWQIWKSVVKTIKVGHGKHYLKIVAVTGGFNINFFDIQKSFTGFNELTIDKLNIYPNPVSNEIVIKTVGFEYNKVEIIDMAGKTVLQKSTPYKQEFHLPIHLVNGVYTLKISNKNDSLIKRIIVENK